MHALLRLWRTTVGKKVVMALTGAGLVGFVLGHMAGNLKLFLGRAAYNHYAEFLRHAGEPLLPAGVGLWLARLGLLACLGLHLVAALQLYATCRNARPVLYERYRTDLVFSKTSLMMRLGGSLLGMFIVLHLAHLTWGWLYPAEYVPGDPYHNVVAGFQHVWLSALYIVAMVPLSLHLYHGTWSAFQTLGLAGPLVNTWRRPFAALVATLVFLGNCSLPVAVLAGVVRPAG